MMAFVGKSWWYMISNSCHQEKLRREDPIPSQTQTKQRIYNVWKIIKPGRTKFGSNWYGSGGYAGSDAFSKHFANLCRECNNSNEVRAKMKTLMIPTILWQGNRIQCMKSSRTLQCKMYMVERKEILSRFRKN